MATRELYFTNNSVIAPESVFDALSSDMVFALSWIVCFLFLKFIYHLLICKFQFRKFLIDLGLDVIFVIVFALFQQWNSLFPLDNHFIAISSLIFVLLVLPIWYLFIKRYFLKKINVETYKYSSFFDILILILSYLLAKIVVSSFFLI